MPVESAVRFRNLDTRSLEVWSSSLHPGGALLSKLVWSHEDAPAGPGQRWLSRTSGATAYSTPVGGVGFGVREVQVGTRSVRAELMGNLAVVAEHRTLRPALTLVRAVMAQMRGQAGLAYGLPNDSAVGGTHRVGFRLLGAHVRYAMVSRHAGYLRRHVRSALLARGLGLVLDLGRSAAVSSRARRLGRNWTLQWVSGFDSRVDGLWEQARGEHAVVARRNAAFLTWRFLHHPWHESQVAVVSPKTSDERVTGYAIVERVRDVLHVRNLFARASELHIVIDLLLAAAPRNGAAAISVACLEQRVLGPLLQARGFASRGSVSPLVVDPDCAAARVDPRVVQADSWYYTDADETPGNDRPSLVATALACASEKAEPLVHRVDALRLRASTLEADARSRSADDPARCRTARWRLRGGSNRHARREYYRRPYRRVAASRPARPQSVAWREGEPRCHEGLGCSFVAAFGSGLGARVHVRLRVSRRVRQWTPRRASLNAFVLRA